MFEDLPEETKNRLMLFLIQAGNFSISALHKRWKLSRQGEQKTEIDLSDDTNTTKQMITDYLDKLEISEAFLTKRVENLERQYNLIVSWKEAIASAEEETNRGQLEDFKLNQRKAYYNEKIVSQLQDIKQELESMGLVVVEDDV